MLKPLVVAVAIISISIDIHASDNQQNCQDCHGENGISIAPTVPTIAGMSELYLMDSMRAYKDRLRPCIETTYLTGPNAAKKTDMCQIADSLDDNIISALATSYSKRSYVPAKQAFDKNRAARGQAIHLRACEKCHENGGSVPEDDAGFLAGQWRPYLQQTLEDFQQGRRASPKKMIPAIEALSADDIQDLLHYYASFQ